MKVLWFTNTPSNYTQDGSSYHGGGWISSLETEIKSIPNISLGIAFFHKDTCFKSVQNKVTYYPIKRNGSCFSKANRFFRIAAQDEKDINLCLQAIEDFKPDIIHVFGTESSFGLLGAYTKTPVVIHLQGLMTPYINAWVPPFYSKLDFFICAGLSPKQIILQIRSWKFNCYAAKRELKIMESAKYLMGRTDWDKAFCELYAPEAKYFHCEEMLRQFFYEPSERCPPNIPTFITTISGPLYKGHDLLLKTAKILKSTKLRTFTWKVFGIKSLRFAEKKTGIKATDVGIEVCGIATAEDLRDELLGCTAFVHPSYIDNSPNSICEAQMLGVPVVACNVGGVSSMIIDGKTGVLVPANDPYTMSYSILKILHNQFSMTETSRGLILSRHNRSQIVASIIQIYTSIQNGNLISTERKTSR